MGIKPNFVTYGEIIRMFLYSSSFVTGKIYCSPLRYPVGLWYVHPPRLFSLGKSM